MGNLKRQCDVSSGREKADIVLKNGTNHKCIYRRVTTGDGTVEDTICSWHYGHKGNEN
ncbi:hypothetical protein I4O85_007090 [Clostridioides difficile]